MGKLYNKCKRELAHKIADIIEDGHVSIGNLTIYGDNAMHYGCVYWSKKYGYICWRLPIICGMADKLRWGDKLYWKPLYFYISRNRTPWAAVFMIGKKHSYGDWAVARIRKKTFGWNYDHTNDSDREKLYQINDLR